MNYKTRCEDCDCLKKVGSEWLCTECFNQKCAEVDDCPLGIEAEDVEVLEEKAKTYKKENAKSEINPDKPQEKKTRTVKISDEKQALFAEIVDFLRTTNKKYTILKENKLIQIEIGDKTFKIDLIQQKKK